MSFADSLLALVVGRHRTIYVIFTTSDFLKASRTLAGPLAAMVRVVHTIAPDCHDMARELEELRIRIRVRPFGNWHGQSFFESLASADSYLREHGIKRHRVLLNLQQRSLPATAFQKVAEENILQKLQTPYYPEARLRQKLDRWKLAGIPGILERRTLSNCMLLKEFCAPRVVSAYFKALWNGWVTDARMRSLFATQGRDLRRCMLGCVDNIDSLDHYCICPVFWRFALTPYPLGLGVVGLARSRNGFFFIDAGVANDDKIRMACGIYALHRTIQVARHVGFDGDPRALLARFTKRAAMGSKAANCLSVYRE